MRVWIVSDMDARDVGCVLSVHSTREGAEAAVKDYLEKEYRKWTERVPYESAHNTKPEGLVSWRRWDEGSAYSDYVLVEEWEPLP